MSSIGTSSLEDQSAIAMIREYAGIAWRSKWIILGCITLSLSLAWGYCLFAPKLYRSETLILAEGQKLLENVVQGSGDGNLEQRIYLIQRQIMSRDFFAPIAQELNLYSKQLTEEDRDSVVQELAGAVKVEMVKKEQAGNFVGRSGIDAFTVSFMHEDPGVAMKVTTRIADKFIEENTKEREKSAEVATEFLDDELRTMKLELEKKEEQISRFKSAHIGELPQQTDANLRMLDRLQTDITAVNESIQRHSDRLVLVDKALQEYRLYGRQNPAFMTVSMEPDPLFRRLKDLREKLIKLKAEFWDEYPEVILTKEEMRQVEEQLVQLYGPDAIKPDKKPLDPYLQDLLRQQSEEKSELSLLKQRQQALYASKKSHEIRVERFPEVEQELLILERDYNNMKSNYAMLLDKRLHARVAENMEKRQQAGKFRILDHANYPRVPSVPNRPRVLAFGFLFGCFLGVGLSVLREQLTPQFRGPEDVEFLLGPQLLAVIPQFSLEWSPAKWQRFFPSTNLPGRPLGRIEDDPLEATEPVSLQTYPSNGYRIEMRFVAKLLPRSMAAEQYRVAAARLQSLNNANGKSTIVAVTSAIKGEGKTTTVLNLGYTLARDFGKRVLLLDCDLACPELKHYIKPTTQFGLVDCLKADIPLEEAMSSFSNVPCWIMPAGEADPDSSELLRTNQLERVLTQLREKFDYILLNAPPILPVATMNVLERHADMLLLVVRANMTSQHAVKRALTSLRASKPIHVILNAVAVQSLPYYMTEYSAIGGQKSY